MTVTKDWKIKVFADGADTKSMIELYRNPLIDGFTTNPTLMRKAGVKDYRGFARELLDVIRDQPVSFEVFSDDFKEMERQALEISSWGRNVFVKVPITNTAGESSLGLVRKLAKAGVQQNVTALMTLEQVRDCALALAGGPHAYVSVFAGRIADTGRDPIPMMRAAVEMLTLASATELIWASPRELLNLYQADEVGCHVITATFDILKKLNLRGKNLAEYSLETVKMFRRDAIEAGYEL